MFVINTQQKNYCNIQKMKTLEGIILQILFIISVNNLYTAPPTWLTSSLVRAGNANIIARLTGNTQTPTYTFPFSSPLSSGLPHLGYGIKAYEGSDYFGEEMFEVNRTYLDNTQFRVAVQIIRTTNIWLMNVPYIAVDPTFPHHLNSFDNVPVNYSYGPIVNISVSSTSTQVFSNRINYTMQASSKPFKTFQQPFTRNKILLFLTSLFITGSNEGSSTTLRPVVIRVEANVVSTSQYLIVASLNPGLSITKLHFSMVIFDQTDVLSSGLYMLVYQKIQLPYTGGFIPIPQEFVDNFIMGLLDFTTNKTQSILDFQWQYTTVNNTFGVYMPKSEAVTRNPASGTNTIWTIRYTVFYMKTWQCPQDTYQTFFDPSLNLCTSCPIVNCLNCQNLYVCSQCNESVDYFYNATSRQCSACAVEGCSDCIDATSCATCNSDGSFSLVNGICQYCNTSANVFLNSQGRCELCTIQNCIACYNLTFCFGCGPSYSPVEGSCQYCNNSENVFLNSQNLCQLCSVPHCDTCFSLQSCLSCIQSYATIEGVCQYCNSSQNKFVDYNKQCQSCSIPDCITCSSLTTCIQCNPGFAISNGYCQYCNNSLNIFLNSNQNCQLCSIPNCATCSSLTYCTYCRGSYSPVDGACQYCNSSVNIFLNQTTLRCQLCTIENCQVCSSLTQCAVCDSRFRLTDGKVCEIVCGVINNTNGTVVSGILDECYCQEKFIWDRNLLACVVNCSAIQYALGVSPQDYNDCICDFHTVWKRRYTKCVLACDDIQHTQSVWTLPQATECVCSDSFIWNSTKRQCEYNCSNAGNSTGQIQQNETQVCVCLPDFTWDAVLMTCRSKHFDHLLGVFVGVGVVAAAGISQYAFMVIKAKISAMSLIGARVAPLPSNSLIVG